MAGTIKAGTLTDGTSSVSTTALAKCAVRAYVCFDGSTTPINIADSFNVSSISDLAVGRYTVNFANPMPSLNYMFIGGGVSREKNDLSAIVDRRTDDAKELSACTVRVAVNGSGLALYDPTDFGIAFLGG